jgi:ribonuclease BN (tRNA processing enzyme)
MRIKVLGCYGTEFLQYKSSGFLIDSSVMLDAGSICSTLSLDEQREIQQILITHSHLDHIKDIFFLLNNLFEEKRQPITVYSTAEILQLLKQHFINGIICPDFTSIPHGDDHVLGFETIKEGEFYPLSQGLSIRAEKVDHNIAAVGYIIKCDHGHIVYTGDTGPTEQLWDVCNSLENLLALFIECSFPNEQQELASLSGHLTPQTMAQELKKLQERDCPVFVFHMKPQYLKAIEADIKALDDERITILAQGKHIDL